MTIENCLADNNAGAGFFTNNNDVHMDENHLASIGNFVTRRSVVANMINYSCNVGATYGPIVDVSSGGSIETRTRSNHRWANFEY
ncbi:MAG: hypothetical protein AAF492_28390 [Verrucomicrobiota bacterium]